MATTKADKRSKLLGKKATTKPIQIVVDGEQIELTVKALDEKTYRDIRAEHPPKSKQDRDNGSHWNTDTFPPHFMSEAIVDPQLTQEEWASIWDSKEWGAGELSDLFSKALTPTISGFDLPFGESA